MSTFFGGVSEREFSEFKSEVNAFLSDFRKTIPNFDKKLDSVIELAENNKSEIDELKITAPLADFEARNLLEKIRSSHNDISEMQNQFIQALREIESYRNNASTASLEVESARESIFEVKNSIQDIYNSSVDIFNEVLNQKKDSIVALEEVNRTRDEFRQYVEEAKSLPDKLNEIQQMLDKCNVIEGSISSIRDNIVKQRVEISNLHKEIFGTEIENSTGEIERIPGKKDEIDLSYNELRTR